MKIEEWLEWKVQRCQFLYNCHKADPGDLWSRGIRPTPEEFSGTYNIEPLGGIMRKYPFQNKIIEHGAGYELVSREAAEGHFEQRQFCSVEQLEDAVILNGSTQQGNTWIEKRTADILKKICNHSKITAYLGVRCIRLSYTVFRRGWGLGSWQRPEVLTRKSFNYIVSETIERRYREWKRHGNPRLQAL